MKDIHCTMDLQLIVPKYMHGHQHNVIVKIDRNKHVHVHVPHCYMCT